MEELTDYSKILKELGDRVVAKTGSDKDRQHVGKLLIQALKDAGDKVSQTDAATGETESAALSLQRSIRCAESFRSLGLKTGDLIMIVTPTILDVAAPIYAALYLGLAVLTDNMAVGDKTDAALEYDISKYKPKLILCSGELAAPAVAAAARVRSCARILSFDDNAPVQSLAEHVRAHGRDLTVDQFEVSNFDPETTTCIVVKSSGTTGVPKAAALSHRNFILGAPTFLCRRSLPDPDGTYFILGGLSWVSSIELFISAPLFNYPRLHTSQQMTTDVFCDIVNKYRPQHACISPPFFIGVIRAAELGQVDISCLKTVLTGGCPVSPNLITDAEKIAPNMEIVVGYGMTEMSGLCMFAKVPKTMAMTTLKNIEMDFKLVHPETGKTVAEPNVTAELWVKSPNVFQGYYNDPELTKEVLTEDGWLKTGDMFYLNKSGEYIFAERIKLILKYYEPNVLKRHYVMVSAVEDVIRGHEAVLDVVVTGVPCGRGGDLPVALVVLKDGASATAQQIKDLVADNMEDHNKLRGGVLFVKSLPTTKTMKIDRKKVKEIANTLKKELNFTNKSTII